MSKKTMQIQLKTPNGQEVVYDIVEADSEVWEGKTHEEQLTIVWDHIASTIEFSWPEFDRSILDEQVE